MSEPMDDMTCRDAVERLWAFLDGELPATEAAAIRSHLEACSRCYPQFDFQKAFCEFLRSRSRESAPSELRARIRELLAREQGGTP